MLAERATAETATAETATAWEGLLDELDARLVAWRAAIDGGGPYPDAIAWPRDLQRCPAHLAGRARRILATQRDLHDRLAARRDAIGALLRGRDANRQHRPAALFVDQRC